MQWSDNPVDGPESTLRCGTRLRGSNRVMSSPGPLHGVVGHGRDARTTTEKWSGSSGDKGMDGLRMVRCGKEEAFRSEVPVSVVLIWKGEIQTRLEWNHGVQERIALSLVLVSFSCTSKIVDVSR